MTFAPHSRIGNYEVLGLLGTGGMGEVYLARDLRLGREVALKVLPPDFASDPERLARLEREAKTVASLNHPNIVTLFGIEEAGETRLLVMERVTGRPLSDLIDAGELPVARILQLAVPIAEALSAAHDKGIVHRDLKPANVMVTDEGRVKVLDFGLATAARRTDAESTFAAGGTITGEGRVLGTIPYMAPEQLRGERVDARADIFAFGAMLYEMAAGVRPFRGDSMMEIAAAVLREEPRPLDTRRPDLPPRLARLVRRCLEKDPRERLQSAIDLRHELQDLADELRQPPARAVSVPATASAPVEASTVPPASGARPTVSTGRRRAPLLVIGLAATVLAGGGLLGWALWGRSRVAPATGEIRSIAVLPFANMMHDPSEDYFVDGMHEALITELARLGTVRVTSRNSVMRYKDHPQSLKAVAQDLGVDALIEGSVLRAGDQVRITAQLILGKTDEHVWAESYDRNLEDVLRLLSDVSHAIASEVQANLGGAAPPEAERTFLRVNPDAYEAYLRGQNALRQGIAQATLDEALRNFREAVRLDPNLAPAWSGIAFSVLIPGLFARVPTVQAAEAAREAAERAVALGDSDGLGEGALGSIELYVDWQFDAARDRLERALRLNPHNAMLRHPYADYLMITGRMDESVEQVRIARDDDPSSPLANGIVAYHLMYARRYDDAIAEARGALKRFPGFAVMDEIIGEALWQQGRYEEALPVFKASFAGDAEGWQVFETGFRSGGPRAANAAYCSYVERRASGRQPNPYGMAACYAAAGDRDTTFAWLEKAYAARLPQLLHVTAEPAFDSVRDDPRYVDLMHRIGIPGH
jgi:TolB-like protein/Flp pilus assembly protein TadD